MTKTTVENGKAIAKINTHNYKKGNYRIRVQYPQNNSYYASTELTRIDGDTTDGNQWSAYSDSWELYTTSAHSSCDEQGVHSGTYRHILWKTKLKLGMVLNVHGTVTNDNRFTLIKITDEAGSNKTIDISKDVGSTTVYYTDGTDTETLGTVSYGGNGEFTLSFRTYKNPDREWELTVNGETVHIPYKPEFADGYYYSFRKWGNGEIIVDEISYSTSSLLNIEPPTPYEYVLSEFTTSRDYATETNTLGSNSTEPSYNNDILNLGIRYDVIMNKPLTVDGSKYYKINAYIDPYTRIGILHDGQCHRTYPYVWGYTTRSDVEMTLLFENGRAFIIIDGKKKRFASNINPSNTNRLTFVSLSNNNTVTSIKEYPDTEYAFTEDKFHQLPLNYYSTDTTYCTSQNIDTSTIRPPEYDDTGDFPVLNLGWMGNVNPNQDLVTDGSKYYVVRGYFHPYDRIGLRFNSEFNAKVLQNMGFTEEGEYTIVFTKRSGNLYMIVHDTESLQINGWNSNNASYQLSFAPVAVNALLYKVVECDTGKLPLYRELWNSLSTESTTTDRTELTYTNNDTVQIGRYRRNILTVPFTPTGECVVTFRHGRGAYLGIKPDTDASNSTGGQAVELSLANSFKPCEVNTLRMIFNNGKVTFILNEHTIKTVDYMSNVAYIYASQSNGISPLEILDIEANTNGGGG